MAAPTIVTASGAGPSDGERNSSDPSGGTFVGVTVGVSVTVTVGVSVFVEVGVSVIVGVDVNV